ncbi:YcnI family copper-binding membrane protein [Nonomuraea rubra]|uniref:YcnI family copper-binding membrane protein n=1 Tax=Nonomuraea rubra TaxID=46180 RepID=UPI0033D05A05
MSFVRRAATVAAAATALTAALALPAFAHVTIQPGTAEQGGFTKVAFRVPNERDNASTTKIEVSFPTDHPLAFVSVKPVPGWTVKVTEGKLPAPVKTEYGDLEEAVTKVVWEGGKINPGEFQEFEVSMGQLPEVDSLMFPTKQTYSGGEVVDWSEAPKADGTEPEHPAPLLKLVPAAEDGATATTPATTPATAAASASASAAPSVTPVAAASSSDGTARLLGGAGLVVGIIGVVIGALGLRRRPSA